ncbi:MAG: glycoside hydrolase [Dethiosulfovibrio peptidovorans]|nr:MAG: glycoside hydrolase [Dethiosulfovibrio peptidovorans]
MNRYVCIHGHFYQPPRENPWLEVVPQQPSAAPWHDWNERITDQCYGPNGAARILDDRGRIVSMRNCYESISYNVGPTLLRWLETHRPWVYRSMIDADRVGTERFGGHGPAMAQVYGHAIMPLASERDRRAQIVWGIADFRRRFGRMPEGMWLAEAAVDLPTLEVLAGEGIRFTVLAPHQISRIAVDGPVDISRPYRCCLPSGREISLFFYDATLAQEIAFGSALDDGRRLAQRMIDSCPDTGNPVLEHVAVDGETFGHHHRFGEMALAACLDELDNSPDVSVTVYGQFLEMMPPMVGVEIIERSSWSCFHGVERWRSDCGCADGGHPGWHQRWRGPLRSALEELHVGLDRLYEEKLSNLVPDPWGTRDRSEELSCSISFQDRLDFLRQEAGRELDRDEAIIALTALEMERCAILMFSSCGWFFDDISRIESIQDLQYAARALDLAESLGEDDLRGRFLSALEGAPSNVPEFLNGRRVFSCFVEPESMDLCRIAAHWGLYSLLGMDSQCTDFPFVRPLDVVLDKISLPDGKACLGTVSLQSNRTGQLGTFIVLALWRGGRRALCGSHPLDDMSPQSLLNAVKDGVSEGDLREIQRIFGHRLYSVRHLFRESRGRVLSRLTRISEDELMDTAGPLVVRDESLLLVHGSGGRALRLAATVLLDHRLSVGLRQDAPDYEGLEKLIRWGQRLGLSLDRQRFEAEAWRKIHQFVGMLRAPQNRDRGIQGLIKLLDLVDLADVKLELWLLQKEIYPLLKNGEQRGLLSELARRVGIFVEAANVL